MEQTNRTILFAEINPQKKNLLSFLMEESKISYSDEDLIAADESLSACSLEEALEKFQPCIQIGLDTEQCRVRCTEDQEELSAAGFHEIHTIHFDTSNKLLNLFQTMVDSSPPQNAVRFVSRNIPDCLFPLPDPKHFEKTRVGAARDFSRGHTGQAALKWKQLFRDYDNSILLIRQFLKLVPENCSGSIRDEAPAVMIEEKEETQVTVKTSSSRFRNAMPFLTAEEQQEYDSLIRAELKASCVRSRELWHQVLCMPYKDLLGGQEQIHTDYQKYQAYYGRIVSVYWDACCPLLETLLGIHSFFSQYRTSDQKMPPQLFCANLLPEPFLDPKNQDRLRTWLRSTNEKTDLSHTIWYAVVPGMEWEERVQNKEVRERFQGSGGKLLRQNSKESVRILLKLLAEARIQSFLSPGFTHKPILPDLRSDGAGSRAAQIRQVAGSSYAAYVYPCLQNFTLVPQEHAAVSLGRILEYSEWGEPVTEGKNRLLWLTGVGIEASYTAAGFFAACQCPGFLNERFPGLVDMESPGAAINTTNEVCIRGLSVTLRMNPVRYSGDFPEALQQNSAGIVFFPCKNRTVLLSDRSASYLYGREDTLHEIQTMTYIERIVRMKTQDFKSASVSRFFQKRPGSILWQWSAQPRFINSILKKDETISCHFDENTERYTLDIRFQGGRKEWEIKNTK